jgi:hypothetical protein
VCVKELDVAGLGLEKYPFLARRLEIKKANLYGVSRGSDSGRFSNAAAVGR